MDNDLNDNVFTIEGGHTMVAGKSKYPDLVRLMIPKDRALELAMDVLIRLRNVCEGDDMLFELPLFGKLEQIEESGNVIDSP